MFSFKKTPLLVSLLLHFMTAYVGLNAQTTPLHPTFNFETFELPGGEMGNHVLAIAQDSFGFMWFGSEFGLHRWDGYQFKTYFKDPEDSTSIASNRIERIYVSKNGTLWIGHGGKGLDRFDCETETFRHYNLNLGDPNNNGNNFIGAITEDREGYLWIGTGNGLLRLDINTDQLKHFQHDPNNINSLSFNVCRALLVDSKGILWVGTGFPWGRKPKGGLNRYRPDTEDFVRYLHDPTDPSSLTNNKVTALLEDSKGNFWVSTIGDGLHLMDRKTGKFQRLQRDPQNPNQLCAPFETDEPSRHIRFMLEDQNHKIWIGALMGAVKYYDPETGYMKDYYFKENDPQSLPGPNPWQMFQSQDGTFWSCTNGWNAKVFKFKESSFEYYPLASQKNTVYSFCESTDQKLWIGTDQSGLLQFDETTKAQTSFDTQSITTSIDKAVLDQSGIDEHNLLNYFLKMIKDKEGRLWIRKFHPFGLFCVDPKTEEIKFFAHNPQDENSIGRGGVTDIFLDDQDQIWAVTSGGELNLYDPEGDRFEKYKFTDSRNSSPSDLLYTLMAPAAGGKIWLVGTGENTELLPSFLIKFDPLTAKFETFNAATFADDPVLQHETIQGVHEDDLGNVWICSDTQLKKINPNTGENKHFRAKHFGSLYFKGMTMDDQGRLWMFGDKISFFDPHSGEKSSYVMPFSVPPSANFTQYVFKDANGFIYFGGKGGFQRLDPRKIGKTGLTGSIKTLIKDFHFLDQTDVVENKEQPIHILTADNIRLAHNQNAFTFRFAALGFQHPESNRHEFKLEGYDEQWRSAGLEPTATYVKVPPGDYTFKGRGATLRGAWGPEQSIRLSISPPWWATWWAYTFYTLFVLGILYAFYSIQLKRNLDKAEARRLKDLDTVKTRLYTNITHEFRTPLTVISGMAAQMKANPKEWFNEGITMIQRNSGRLLELVNQMLDLSKLEDGKMALQLQQGDVITYLKYLVESFHSFSESKKIQVHFLSGEDELFMDFDPEKIKQVLTNLLSNAVKFTLEGGNIYVSIEKHKEGSANTNFVKIKVKDTGRGIPEAEIPYIFDRFYQVDDSTTRQGEGTGIGLALTKELIELMAGEISVKSTKGKGTEFTLLLPVTNEAQLLVTSTAESAVPITPLAATLTATNTPQVPVEDPADSFSQQKPNILIIEDNPDVVAYLASCLQTNYLIKVGQDGQEGIEMALKNIPDLIITDVMMPYKDGFEVCRTLKHDERTSHIPIIMLTARADIESKLEGLEEGADAYLAKPFNKEELLIRIKKLLELRASLRQYYRAIVGLSDQGAPAAEASPVSAALEDAFIKKAKEIVDSHLDDFNFNMDKFCKEIGLSHSQLHRKLSALTGLSAGKFIRHIRLRKAKELLRDPEQTITSVAFDTGFNDPSYFGRVFKKEFDMTPKEWQEKE